MLGRVSCIDCGNQYSQNEVYNRVSGWERHRSGGGTNAIKLREPDYSQIVCVGCMMEREIQTDSNQGSLF